MDNENDVGCGGDEGDENDAEKMWCWSTVTLFMLVEILICISMVILDRVLGTVPNRPVRDLPYYIVQPLKMVRNAELLKKFYTGLVRYGTILVHFARFRSSSARFGSGSSLIQVNIAMKKEEIFL